MKNFMWVILIVVALLLGWMLRGMQQPPEGEKTDEEGKGQDIHVAVEKPSDWSQITIEVEYENGKVAFNEEWPHDTAIVDQQSVIDFNLICEGCPTGATDKTEWVIKEFVRVAALPWTERTLIGMHLDRGIPNATREELGLLVPDQDDNRVNIALPIDPVDWGTSIQAVVQDDIPGHAELWKYNTRVCACDSELGDDCSKEPTRCLDIDPHVWAHDRKS